MRKKITRIFIFLILLLVALVIALPSLMEKKVGQLLKANVNNSIDGQFDFTELSLSLYSDFPIATVALDSVSLINMTPFEGDTLFRASHVVVKMGVKEFFQGVDDPIEIKEFAVKDATLDILINEQGLANYDITDTSEDDQAVSTTENSTILAIRSYEISNSKIIYQDKASDYHLIIEDFNHSGSGDLSATNSELDTSTEAVVSFTMESTKYLDQNTVQLQALLGIDLESNIFTFKENKAVINRLPFAFDGSIRIGEEEQEMDLSFKTISSDFKNFLALIPEKYSKDITHLQTEGNFDISGSCKGILSEETIPEFNVQMTAQNASFKYPDLPKKVENIFIDAVVENTTGIADDTAIRIEKASFKIDEDVFELQALITELNGNTDVQSHAKGTVNLSKLAQAYPVPSSVAIRGNLKGNISSSFNLEAIENKDYKNIDLKGKVEVRGLNYAFETLPHPLKVHTLDAELDSKKIEITEVAGITGSTDFSATGQLQTILGFLFNEEVLKGEFDMRSNSFVVADLIQEETSEEDQDTDSEESFKVPTYLDIELDALVGKAIYDDIVMYDLAGNLRIKDEVITFSQISSRMFDGRAIIDGMVSTKGTKPSFDLTLDMSKLNIGSTFQAVDLLNTLSPAAKALDGRLSTKIALSGNLTDGLDLDLSSLTGDMLAEILTANIDPEKAPVMNLLDTKLGFVAFDKMDLSGLKTALSFDNGKVHVKPFRINYDDISMEVSGGHSFANALNYNIEFDVPAHYLGNDVNKLLASIDDESLESITVPVIANIGGSYGQPSIKTDLKAQVRDLTDQLVEIQKQKYINKGKKQVNELVSNVLSGSKEESQESDVKKENSNVLVDAITKSTSRKTDSAASKTNSDKAIKETAKSILGGLLGSKNKAVTAKDTLN